MQVVGRYWSELNCKCGPITSLYVLQPSRPGACFFSPNTTSSCFLLFWLLPCRGCINTACSGHSTGPCRISLGWPLPQRSESGGATHHVASTDRSIHMYPLT
uniref:Uncharacterized protein n=1 Tax=Bos indicus x Bos taurus TaxID=30522 RepID=A0A4W2GNY8_BOBOX